MKKKKITDIKDSDLEKGIDYLTKKDWLIFDSAHPKRIDSIKKQLKRFIIISIGQSSQAIDSAIEADRKQ